MPDLKIRRAEPHETRAVLRWTLAGAGQSPAEIEGHVTLFLQYARDMQLPAARHWWAEVDGDAVCACTCVESPGRTAMLFLPDGSLRDTSHEVIAELAACAVEDLSTRDVNLLQVLLAPDDAANAAALRRAGFRELAELLYLEWNAVAGAGELARASAGDEALGLSWAAYDVKTESEFCEVISATYIGSMDCPGLNGLRSIDDTIQGHKSAGRFDPARWLLLRRNGKPVACNLLSENPLRPVVEIVYMGVHPDARGLGLGRRILREGLRVAHHAGFTRVTLAVDARNQPAMNLYRTEGFRESMRRRALIRAITPTFRHH